MYKIILFLLALRAVTFAKEENSYLLLARKTETPSRQEIYTHFLSASLLERAGNLERALKEYNKTLELEPEATWVLNARANLHLKMGNPEKALADALKYAQIHSKDPQAHLLVANIHLSMNQKIMARAALEKALQEDPIHEESLLLLGQLLADEDAGEAIQILSRLTKIHPGSSEAYYALGFCYQKLNQLEKAISAFKKVVELDPNSSQSLMLLGQMSDNNGQTEEAIAYYEKALAKSPGKLSLRLQLVNLYHRKKEYEKIVLILKDYTDDSPADAQLHSWLGIAYEQIQQPKNAIFYYEKASNYTQNPEIYLRLASLYSREEDLKNVLATLKNLNKKFPKEPKFLYLLGLATLDAKEFKTAIPLFKSVLELDSNHTAAHFQLGVIYDTLKKWEKAEFYFSQVLRTDPKHASSYNYLGYTYADKNIKLDVARDYLQKAMELDVDNPAFQDSFGWLLYREKRFSEALPYLEKSAKSLPDATVFLHLGDCYLALGNLAQASLSYDRALELEPKLEDARKKLESLNMNLVPTSPARKILKMAQRNLESLSYLSGTLHLKFKGKSTVSSMAQGGSFYLKKGEILPSLNTPTFLRVDLADPKSLLTYTLWFQNSPKKEWTSNPAEMKVSLPAETGDILDWIASLFNGRFLTELDHWETSVRYGRKFIELKNKNIRAKISRSGDLMEIESGGWILESKKFRNVGSSILPSLIKISAEKTVEIEFFEFSTEKFEEKLFQTGKK